MSVGNLLRRFLSAELNNSQSSNLLNKDVLALSFWAMLCVCAFIVSFSIAGIAQQRDFSISTGSVSAAQLSSLLKATPHKEIINLGSYGDMTARKMMLAHKDKGQLYLSGHITAGGADEFVDYVEKAKLPISHIVLNSTGGALDEALKIGRYIRQKGWNTTVGLDSVCLSACPIILAAGLKRSVGEGAQIGVHQLFADPSDERGADIIVSDAQILTAKVARYLSTMQVDEALWLHALETKPEYLYYLSQNELRDYRLITN